MKKQIILITPGAITTLDKKRLEDEGYLVVICENHENFKLVFPSIANLKGDEVLQAALKALEGPTSQTERRIFGERIIKLLMKDNL
jgi:hypothetical protein